MELNFFLIIMLVIMLIDYHGMTFHKFKRIFFTSFAVISICIAILAIIMELYSDNAIIVLSAEVIITLLMFSLAIFYIAFLYTENILLISNLKRLIIILSIIAVLLLIGIFAYIHTFLFQSNSQFLSEVFILFIFIALAIILTIKLGNNKNVSWKIKLLPVCLIIGLICDIMLNSKILIAVPLAIDIFFIYAYRATFNLNKDPLTGVYNRRLLEVNESLIINPPGRLIVFIIDIDKFKFFNDTYGHQEGDKVLQIVAQILQKSVRKNDFCIRYGGDEFALIVKLTDEICNDSQISNLADGIISRVQKELIKYNKSAHYTQNLSVSIGWATAPSQDYKSAIKSADERMYKIKNHLDS